MVIRVVTHDDDSNNDNEISIDSNKTLTISKKRLILMLTLFAVIFSSFMQVTPTLKSYGDQTRHYEERVVTSSSSSISATDTTTPVPSAKEEEAQTSNTPVKSSNNRNSQGLIDATSTVDTVATLSNVNNSTTKPSELSSSSDTSTNSSVVLVSLNSNNNLTISSSNSTLPIKRFIPWKQRKSSNITLPCELDLKRDPTWDPFNQYIQNQPSDEGILYVKIEKAASTSLASTNGRIAIALAHRLNKNNTRPDTGDLVPKICRSRGMGHLWSKRTKKFNNRNKDKSFLWTFLKEPMKRELSLYYFFGVDWKENEDTEETFQQWMLKLKRGSGSDGNKIKTSGYLNLFSDYDSKAKKELSKDHPSDDDLNELIQKALADTDFLGLVERLDESLVLLALMFDIPVTDVINIDAKVAGGYMYRSKHKRCERNGYKRPMADYIKEYFEGEEWKRISKVDYMLYDAVNRSLDATIDDVIGRDIFDRKFQEYMEAKQLASQLCFGNITFVCNEEGQITNETERTKCYKGDIGCGYECLDRLFPFS